jgi:hypothetical protein
VQIYGFTLMIGLTKNRESEADCPLCGSTGRWVFYTASNVPASCNRLWNSKRDAVNCPKGNIKLVFCPSCTFVSNVAIEPEKNQYDSQYDNSLFYSAHFQEFAKKLSTSLIDRYNLHGKNIVEIGGGKVDFLTLLIGLDKNCGCRFNPFNSKVENAVQKKVIPSISVWRLFPFLDEGREIDFVFSYHELEHINDPKNFLKNLRKALNQSSSARVFFSVPNALKAFDEGDYSDIIYEHVSYFTIPSLYFLFSTSVFDISNVEETKAEIFDSIYVDATLKQDLLPSLKTNLELSTTEVEQFVRRFAAKTEQNITGLSQQLTKLLDKGNRIVVWGAGARGVTFLNIFKDQRIEYAVDINPNKQGKYVPGTGQKIVEPKFLVKYKPDFILLANPAYGEEIKHTLDELSITARFISI